MPFNGLLLNCLSPKTSCAEGRAQVFCKKGADEAVLFFHVDPESNPHSTVRQDLPLEGPVCDYVVVYRSPTRVQVCLVELKGGADLRHAVDQVLNTGRALKQALKQALAGKQSRVVLRDLQWTAYVLLHGSAPRDTRQQRGLLEGFFDRAEVSREPDIGRFLRC